MFYFNFKKVSVHIFYASIYMLHVDAYEYTISNKFEISNKKNSRGIYNIYSISGDHIQLRTSFHPQLGWMTIYNFEQVSISGMHINFFVLGIVFSFRIDDFPHEKSR